MNLSIPNPFPRKWNLPLTYAPKIQPVTDGKIRQTIRPIGKNLIEKEVGDLIRFYIWTGRPYRSKRKTITEYMPLKEALALTIFPYGIDFPSSLGGRDQAPWEDLDVLAAWDGIVPPTGEALRDVLMSKNEIPDTGIQAQVLRW
jgi:hypothetical protein